MLIHCLLEISLLVKKVCLELMIQSTLKLKAHIMFGVRNSSADYLYHFYIEINDMLCLLHLLG